MLNRGRAHAAAAADATRRIREKDRTGAAQHSVGPHPPFSVSSSPSPTSVPGRRDAQRQSVAGTCVGSSGSQSILPVSLRTTRVHNARACIGPAISHCPPVLANDVSFYEISAPPVVTTARVPILERVVPITCSQCRRVSVRQLTQFFVASIWFAAFPSAILRLGHRHA
ncbi:hypothetical protein BC628DRAFT_1006240 [Trametes gibbosa]|nr:hypothetical protein BC628DRAFT_1006240 [Trametes gibbosa]